jgi:membrane fusion protein, multidrug efflux system
MTMQRKYMVMALVPVIAIGIGVAATRTFASRPPAPPSTPQAVPVVAGTVASHNVPIYLRGVGTVIAYNNVIVRSQVQGQLTKIAFTQGQQVHAGDLLAEIDPRPYQAQLDQATAARDRDQAQFANAQANFDRNNQLLGKGFATSQLVETQKAQVAQLDAMIKADEAQIEGAKTNLSYTRIAAPIDGVTGIRQIDQGNIIHPTDPNGLVDITQVQPISVLFTLPQTYFAQIQQGMANGTLEVVAYSQDQTTQLDRGKLALIDNQIIQTTGTLRLRADFPNDKHLLWPGALVNMRLLIETRHGALTVPASAVQQGPKGPYVYVIGNDQKAAMRSVTVAQIDAVWRY